jgi:hypothetical protein
LTEIEDVQKMAMDDISRKLLDEVLKESKPITKEN